jgi:hypothetical protein
MHKNDNYVVRVKSHTSAASSFIWELCRGDGVLVLRRSTKAFPTRVEALFDSVQHAIPLAFEPAQHLPLEVI